LKIWPRRRWKQILLLSALVIVVVPACLLAYVLYAINADIVTELVVMNADGHKAALVLYHPGLSSFAHDVAYAFADGLVSEGWRVEIATPSPEAPTNASRYGLLVICASTYGGKPDAPTMRHLARMGDLGGINAVIVALSGGETGGEMTKEALQRAVSSAHGTIIKLLNLYNSAPNEGGKSATELAEQAGSAIIP
jgi:hypothetical protein